MNKTRYFFIFALLGMAYLFAGTSDYNDAVAMEAERKAAPAPRESWALRHPLAHDGPWVKNCPDFQPCKLHLIEDRK